MHNTFKLSFVYSFMTQKNQIWKCEICGNIIEVVHEGADSLVCCGESMKLQEEHTEDPEKGEKHVPVIERTEKGILVKIGSMEHPMTEEHHIEWIEVIVDGTSYKKFLKLGDKPEAEFCITESINNLVAREYCNLHGLWKAEK
jgi:superoxide reductase